MGRGAECYMGARWGMRALPSLCGSWQELVGTSLAGGRRCRGSPSGTVLARRTAACAALQPCQREAVAALDGGGVSLC